MLAGGARRLLAASLRVWRRGGTVARRVRTRASDLPPGGFASALYFADPGDRRRPGPDLAEAKRFFETCREWAVPHLVVVSSAAVHEPSAHHPGMAAEDHPLSNRTGNPIARRWRDLEELARRTPVAGGSLTLLRPAAFPTPRGGDYFSRLFRARWTVRLAGHDPTLQILDFEDLALAISAALDAPPAGVAVRHVAPSAPIPLRRALAAAGVRAVPVPRLLQRPLRRPLARLGLAFPIQQLDYVRYGWTIDSRHPPPKFPKSSHEALLSLRGGTPREEAEPDFDDFGMDRAAIDRWGRGLFKFLHDVYWRVDLEGVENIPREGPGVLVGVHRGFMPFDGVMALHEAATRRGRYPRFLIHPGLVKFPFFFDFITKLGGVPACRENARRILESGQILGVFPEGVRGAFSMYREAYRIKKFGRLEFVRFAIRHRVPILPFVTVGSAETFPILAKIEWNWWRRQMEWPFLPITPTFPWLPLPLPSKWRTRYLEPIHVERSHPPEAADDPAAVRAVGQTVRRAMQSAIDELLAGRKSIFLAW